MTEAVIVDIIRTPSGKGKPGGALSGVHPAALLAQTLTALVERNGLDTALVDDVIAGCVRQIGDQSLNIARTALLAGRLPGERAGDDRGPAVRVEPAGGPLRGPGRDRRRLRHRHRLRGGVDEPGADRVVAGRPQPGRRRWPSATPRAWPTRGSAPS